MTDVEGREKKRIDRAFLERTVMAMATEMAEAHQTLTSARVQFAALAASLGIKVHLDQISKCPF